MEARSIRILACAMLLLATSTFARADDVACVSTTFNFLSPNDKVCVSDFDDLKVPGGTCFISQARKGGCGQPLGLNEDPCNFSVSWRTVLSISGASNVSVVGGTLEGERDRHQGNIGEAGMGIRIDRGADTVTISGVTARKM